MTPADKIRAAIAEMERRQIRILQGERGVLPGLLSGDWVMDPKRRPLGVSPLGAVLLHLQPDASRQDIADHAAQALGVGIAWVEGFADGFDGESSSYYLGGLERRQYHWGLETGFLIRFELTVACPECASRHFRCDPCPLCEEKMRRQGIAVLFPNRVGVA